jgi:hypothetical protein
MAYPSFGQKPWGDDLKGYIDGRVNTLANLPVGGVFTIVWDTDHWEDLSGATISSRPTSRTDVTMIAKGGSSGPGFAITGDLWFEDVS